MISRINWPTPTNAPGSLATLGCLAFFLAGWARAAPVVVTVTDRATGKAVGGAKVERLCDTDAVSSFQQSNVTPVEVGATDGSGRISLDCRTSDRTAFVVTADGETPRAFGFWGCLPLEYRLTMSPATKNLGGRILDPAGNPMPGATVRVRITNYELAEPLEIYRAFPVLGYCLSARTDSNGQFSTPAPDGDAVGVDVEKAGVWLRAQPPIVEYDQRRACDRSLREGMFAGSPNHANSGEVSPVAPETGPSPAPTLTIHLRVMDADTGKPIGRVRITPAGAMLPERDFHVLRSAALDLTGENVTWSFYDGGWAYALRVEANGYATAPTRLVRASETKASLELKLTKASTVSMAALTPDGRPAAGARAFLATPTNGLRMPLGEPRWNDPEALSVADGDGVIRFSPPAEPYRLAISHAAGYAEVSPAADGAKPVKLTAWASLRIAVGPTGKPLPHADLDLRGRASEDLGCLIWWSCDYKATDAEGRASFVCPAGRCPVFAAAPLSAGDEGRWKYVRVNRELTPGERVDMPLMTGTKTVVARLPESSGYRWRELAILPDGPASQLPQNINQLSKDEAEAAVEKAEASAPDRTAAETIIKEIDFTAREDETMALAGLRPGTYLLQGRAERALDSFGSAPAARPELHWYFSVPASGPLKLDVGLVSIAEPLLPAGQVVPELDAKTLDGEPFELKSLRGKWVLLDFWGTWCPGCIAEEPNLKDAYLGWGLDGRLAMVSASVGDATADQVRRHVAEHQLPWTQLFLGPFDQAPAKQPFGWNYDMRHGYPNILLISPDGKLVAVGLRGADLRAALTEHLGAAAPKKDGD